MPGKNPTVKSLKIGDCLLLGAYSPLGNGENPVPIRWLKASTKCDFITEQVVDMLTFDAREDWGADYRPEGVPRSSYRHSGGDPNYPLANIFQFLNSDEEQWYVPAHDVDRPPDHRQQLVSGYGGDYVGHYGFLRYFAPEEKDAMIEQSVHCEYGVACGRIHLMSIEDVFSENKLPLFRKRRGVRAAPTTELRESRKLQYREQFHYCDYYLRSRKFDDSVAVLGLDAYRHTQKPEYPSGIRPIVRLNPDAKIAPNELHDDLWEIASGHRATTKFVIPDDPLSLLGLV